MGLSYPEIARFSRDLGGLLNLGYSLEEAVEKSAESQESELKNISKALVDSLRKGETLSQALEPHKGKFPLFVRFVESAEAGEALAEGLLGASRVFSDIADRRSRCFLATFYPALVFTIASIGTAALITFCGGLFEDLFMSMNLSLPLPTRIFLLLTKFILTPVGLVVFLAPLALLWTIVLGKTPAANLLYKVPIIGRWLKQQEAVLFLNTTGQLLDIGTSLRETCEVALTVCSEPIRQKLLPVPARLESGDSLSQALRETQVIPEIVLWTLEQREQAEDLRLADISVLLQRELDIASDTGSMLFEPLIFLLVLFGIGSFIGAIFLPIYQLIGNLG